MNANVIGTALLDTPLRVMRALTFNGHQYQRGDLLKLDGPVRVEERRLKIMVSQGRLKADTDIADTDSVRVRSQPIQKQPTQQPNASELPAEAGVRRQVKRRV